ncbi:MAG: hypothetical protein ABIV48_05155 [Pyrinomonadaceae bacterium]
MAHHTTDNQDTDKQSTTSANAGAVANPSAAQSTGENKSPSSTGNGVEKAKETASNVIEQAKSTASDAFGAVKTKAAATADDKKSEFTAGLAGVADTVRRVSDTIGDGDAKNPLTEYAAQYTETAAKKLDNVAKYFDETEIRAMARDLESYARRNPAIFLGGAFALGVLAARFFKSTPPSATAAAAGASAGTGRSLDTGNKTASKKSQADSGF